MRISLKRILTHSLLAISIAVPTFVVISVSSAEAGGNHHKRYYKKSYSSGHANNFARHSIRGSFRLRVSSSHKYRITQRRSVYSSHNYVNRYRQAPVRYYNAPTYTQTHHHHYVLQSHNHHYSQPHTRYCR